MRKAHPSVISQNTPNKVLKKSRVHLESPLFAEEGKNDKGDQVPPNADTEKSEKIDPKILNFQDPNFPLSHLDTCKIAIYNLIISM